MAKSLEQIESQIARLQQAAKALRAKEAEAVIARIKEAIAYYELTPQDLFGRGPGRPAKASAGKRAGAVKPTARGRSARRGPVPVKYRDDSGNTWTGRGNRPRWLVAELASGKKLDDFLVRA